METPASTTDNPACTCPPGPARRMHFGIVLLLSFLLFTAGFILDLTIRWTDHWRGFVTGLVGTLGWSIPWCVIALPWALGCRALARRNTFIHRWFVPLALLPSLGVLTFFTVGFIVHPPDAAGRFHTVSGTTLPGEARNLRFHHMGIFDSWDVWYLETTPGEIDRLVSKLDLVPQGTPGQPFVSSRNVRPQHDWPDFTQWPGLTTYQRADPEGLEISLLLTDAEKTRAYIFISSL